MDRTKKLTAKERLSAVKKLKDNATAITQIKEILNDHPRYVGGWIELGLRYRRQGDHPSALKTLEAASKFHPKHQKLRLELSTEQLFLNKITECCSNLKTLLKIDPNNVKARVILGKAYLKDYKKLLAINLFKQALNLNPRAVGATIELAKQLREQEKFDEAIIYLEKALVHFPKHCDLLINLGELEQKRQRFEVALKYFQRAIAHHPKRIRAYICQINTLWNWGHFEEAKSQLKQLQTKHPDDFAVLIRSGQLALKLGQRKQAIQWFKLARTKTSKPAQERRACLFIAEELRVLGRLDEALELMDSTINRYPDNLDSQLIKGKIWQTADNFTRAAEVYKCILSVDPRHFDARIALAKIYGQCGRVEQATLLLEQSDRLLGKKIQTLMLRGLFYQAIEEWELAEIWYRKTLQEYPEHPVGYLKLAKLLFIQGDCEAAIELLQTVYEKFPHHPQVAYELIELQMRTGNFDLSERLLRDKLQRFAFDIKFLWQLCRLKIKQGEYSTAHDALNKISTDNPAWLGKTEQLRTTICFAQYDYQKAEEHIRKAIDFAPTAAPPRTRLASLLSLTGRIDEAYRELRIATEKLILKISVSKSTVPLKSTWAGIINLLRINPPMMTKLLAAQQQTGWSKILAFGKLLAEEPDYFGSALYLARELRAQGIFDRLQQLLSDTATDLPAIPRRIIQFWDSSEPPPEVLKICQSWQNFNPEYEYRLFSLDMATAFLEEHYDARVMKAFANCEQPATQADFFRLAYLNQMGGFYADADDLCRQSLDKIVDLKPELVILQEDVVTIGNNFLGCLPGQAIIRNAFERAVNNLSDYCNESPWSKTGPGLLTSAVCSGLLPYLDYEDYRMWPRLLVLRTEQLKKIVNSHVSLPYKATDKSWSHEASKRRIKAVSVV